MGELYYKTADADYYESIKDYTMTPTGTSHPHLYYSGALNAATFEVSRNGSNGDVADMYYTLGDPSDTELARIEFTLTDLRGSTSYGTSWVFGYSTTTNNSVYSNAFGISAFSDNVKLSSGAAAGQNVQGDYVSDCTIAINASSYAANEGPFNIYKNVLYRLDVTSTSVKLYRMDTGALVASHAIGGWAVTSLAYFNFYYSAGAGGGNGGFGGNISKACAMKLKAAWQRPSAIYKKISGVWQQVQEVYKKVNGNWELLWQGELYNFFPTTGSTDFTNAGFVITENNTFYHAYDKTDKTETMTDWYDCFNDPAYVATGTTGTGSVGAWKIQSDVAVTFPYAIEILELYVYFRTYQNAGYEIRLMEEGTSTWTLISNKAFSSGEYWTDRTETINMATAYPGKRWYRMHIRGDTTIWWGNSQCRQVQITKYKL